MSPLDAARALVPWWVMVLLWSWGAVLGALAYAVTRWAVGRPPVAADGEHWSNSARRVQTRRQILVISRVMVIVVAVFTVMGLASWVDPSPWRLLVAFELVTLGPFLAGVQFEAGLLRKPMRAVLRSRGAFALSSTGVLYAMPVIVAFRMRVSGFAVAFVVAVGAGLIVLFTAGWGVWVASKLGLARPGRPSLAAMVQKAGGARRVWELDWLMANAFAFPLAKQLVFSTVLLEQFTGAEIEAIAHHEVGHLRESWPTKLMRPLALVVVMGLVLAAPELMTGGTLALAAAVAGLLIVIVVVRRVGRHAETAADAHAHDSHDERSYALALERVYAVNQVPAVLAAPGVHGHLYDRMKAAGLTPSWARPEKPERARKREMLLVLGLFAPLLAAALIRSAPGLDPLVRIAMGNDSGWPVSGQASQEYRRERPERARVWLVAAQTLKPDDASLMTFLAELAAWGGDCELAKTFLTPAQALQAPEASARARRRIASCTEGLGPAPQD